jgi:hypothetical protein
MPKTVHWEWRSYQFMLRGNPSCYFWLNFDWSENLRIGEDQYKGQILVSVSRRECTLVEKNAEGNEDSLESTLLHTEESQSDEDSGYESEGDSYTDTNEGFQQMGGTSLTINNDYNPSTRN